MYSIVYKYFRVAFPVNLATRLKRYEYIKKKKIELKIE